MTKYMSKKRFVMFCITTIIDISLILFTLIFASASSFIKGLVVAIMIGAMVYEVFDATKEYRANKKSAGNKTGCQKDVA